MSDEDDEKSNVFTFRCQTIELVKVYFDKSIPLHEAVKRFGEHKYTDVEIVDVEERKFLEAEEW